MLRNWSAEEVDETNGNETKEQCPKTGCWMAEMTMMMMMMVMKVRDARTK